MKEMSKQLVYKLTKPLSITENILYPGKVFSSRTLPNKVLVFIYFVTPEKVKYYKLFAPISKFKK